MRPDANLRVRALLVAALTVAATTAAQAEPEAAYRLGPNDVLSIVVVGHEDISYREREPIVVRPDGTISFPLMSTVQVVGKTGAELEKLIEAGLSRRFKHVEVAVNLVQPRPNHIYVLGEVNKPGTFDLAHEDIGVREALALAEGLTPQASKRNCYLYGRNVDPVRLDLAALLSDPDNGGQLRLRPGDTLVVQKKNTVAVVGEVKTSGVYEMEDGARVLDAIAAAQGLTELSDRRQAILLRADRNNNALNLEAALSSPASDANALLRGGDTLLIKEARNEVAVLGAVEEPGAFYAAAGLTAAQAIALAGGAKPEADLAHVKLLRPAQDPQILDLRPLVERTRTTGLEQFAATGDAIVLQRGDTLVVPERFDRVIVLGAVKQPGAYPIRPGDRVTDVIANAGGYQPGEAKAYRVALLRRAGDRVSVYKVDLTQIMRGRNQSKDCLVQDGDVVVLPGRQKLDWQYYANVLYGVGGFARFTYDIIQ